jgi:hypothetical protein
VRLSQCWYCELDALRVAKIPTRRDDQGASDEDLGYGVNGGACYCTQDDQKFDPVAPLPQPHSNHTSKFSYHRHRIRCRFLQYSSSASHVRMIRRLYLRKHHQSPSSLFLPSVVLVLDLDNDFLRVLRLVLPSGDSLPLCFIDNLRSNSSSESFLVRLSVPPLCVSSTRFASLSETVRNFRRFDSDLESGSITECKFIHLWCISIVDSFSRHSLLGYTVVKAKISGEVAMFLRYPTPPSWSQISSDLPFHLCGSF